jgi:hypothetical protein
MRGKVSMMGSGNWLKSGSKTSGERAARTEPGTEFSKFSFGFLVQGEALGLSEQYCG